MVSFNWPGSGTGGTPVTVGVGRRLLTMGTLGRGRGLEVGSGRSEGKESEGAGSWGRRPADAWEAGKTNSAHAAHVASAARRNVRNDRIRFTIGMVGGNARSLYG